MLCKEVIYSFDSMLDYNAGRSSKSIVGELTTMLKSEQLSSQFALQEGVHDSLVTCRMFATQMSYLLGRRKPCGLLLMGSALSTDGPQCSVIHLPVNLFRTPF